MVRSESMVMEDRPNDEDGKEENDRYSCVGDSPKFLHTV